MVMEDPMIEVSSIERDGWQGTEGKKGRIVPLCILSFIQLRLRHSALLGVCDHAWYH